MNSSYYNYIFISLKKNTLSWTPSISSVIQWVTNICWLSQHIINDLWKNSTFGRKIQHKFSVDVANSDDLKKKISKLWAVQKCMTWAKSHTHYCKQCEVCIRGLLVMAGCYQAICGLTEISFWACLDGFAFTLVDRTAVLFYNAIIRGRK